MTIIDEQAVQKGDEFLGEFPCIHQSVKIQFISSKPLSSEFRNQLKEFAPEVTYVVLAFENDELDYRVSTLIIEEFDQLPVALRLKNSNYLLHTHNIDQHQFKETFHYTDSKDISNKKYIIQDEMSHVAKMIHNIYSTENKSTPLDLWKNLSRMKQDSNMAQADHIDTKLHALGVKRIRNENAINPIPENEFHKILEPLKRSLARAEHNRWNAFYFTNGWRPCEPNDPYHKNEHKKRHACLVEWDELDEVSQIHSTKHEPIDYKKYDSIYIERLYFTLNKIGYSIEHLGGEKNV